MAQRQDFLKALRPYQSWELNAAPAMYCGLKKRMGDLYEEGIIVSENLQSPQHETE